MVGEVAGPTETSQSRILFSGCQSWPQKDLAGLSQFLHNKFDAFITRVVF